MEVVAPSQAHQRNSLCTNQIGWGLFGIGLVASWLLSWQAIMHFELLNPALLSSPSTILVRLYRSLWVTDDLRAHLWMTVTRLLGGFVIGALLALWFGRRMGRNTSADLRYGPFFAAIGLIPVLAALPFLIIMFGVREPQKWLMVGAAVFYPVLYCTKTGMRVSLALQHARQSSDNLANRQEWQDSSEPWIFTGLKLGSLIGLATLLGGEMHTSNKGLGFEILSAMASLQFERAYTATFAVALVEYALWLCLTGIEFALRRKTERAIA